ncbi:MAG: carboxypeptidase-like regulatory domain-containing protein, partial [Acidobacteriaceae bacterium]
MTKKLWLATALITPLAAFGQAASTASIHGHAQDPSGVPMANAQIQISTDGKTALYTFNADQNGDYKGDNIKPGTYVLTMYIKGPNDANYKPVDRFENVKIEAGQNVAQDFDLSRPEYVKKLSPEEQKQLAETKSKNAGIMKENAQVKNLNGDLATARQNIKDKKFDDAASLMQKDTAAKPDAAVLWVELAIAQ